MHPLDLSREHVKPDAAPAAAEIQASPREADRAKLIGRIAASLLIVGVIYTNIAIIFNYPLSRIAPSVSLPMNWRVHDCFQIFGVFSWFEMINRDIEIYGITAPTAGEPEGRIVQLDLAEYFPFHRGEMQSRAMVGRDLYLYGPVGQFEAYRALSAKIRARYARLHPEAPVEKIVFAEVTWRRNLQGFELLKVNETLRILYSD